jgi:hypothetical protein
MVYSIINLGKYIIMDEKILMVVLNENIIANIKKGLPCKVDYNTPDGKMSLIIFHQHFSQCDPLNDPNPKQPTTTSVHDKQLNPNPKQPTTTSVHNKQLNPNTSTISKPRGKMKVIKQYDKTGKFIKSFKNGMEAANEVAKKNGLKGITLESLRKKIGQACKTPNKICEGFRWSF